VPKRCARRLQITPDIITDDVRLGEALDQVLLTDRTLQRIHRQIVRRQKAFRGMVTDDQWAQYMPVEELFNDRWARALGIVAKAFYEAGTRARRSHRR